MGPWLLLTTPAGCTGAEPETVPDGRLDTGLEPARVVSSLSLEEQRTLCPKVYEFIYAQFSLDDYCLAMARPSLFVPTEEQLRSQCASAFATCKAEKTQADFDAFIQQEISDKCSVPEIPLMRWPNQCESSLGVFEECLSGFVPHVRERNAPPCESLELDGVYYGDSAVVPECAAWTCDESQAD